jgi:hypothetical protein
MTVRDVWKTNIAFQIVMTIIAGVGVAAVVGGVAFYAQGESQKAVLEQFQAEFHDFRDEVRERLRYLERSRRGLPPGEP